uniref:Uncharacterized protein n=1 Tax=Periophthalmus magnuspinnatus TaxID=409849 RepID=A0A3B4AZ61_9GOBI
FSPGLVLTWFAADAQITTQIMASNVELHMLNTGRPPLVIMVTRQYQGHVGSSLIRLSSYVSFVAVDSGAAAAVSVFEDRFKPNMELKKAEHLVRDAIAAGIFCDLRSGSNVDLCVIMEKGVEMKRGYEIAAKRGQRIKPGLDQILKQSRLQLTHYTFFDDVKIK